jgi:flagellin
MRINTNVMALNAQNMLSKNQGSVEKSVGRLSSGLRINGASDDAAGLAISEKMRAQIKGLGKAQDNAQDGISLLQTAEGALQQTTDILQRMRELVIKAQNTGVLTEEDRTSISTELSTLRDEIDRIGESTTFNGKQLLNGEMGIRVESNSLTKAQSIDASNAKAGIEYTLAYDSTAKKMKLTWTEDGATKTALSEQSFEANTVKLTGNVNFKDAGVAIDFGDTEVTVSDALNGSKFKTANITGEGKADFKIGSNTYSQDMLSVGIGDMTSKGLNRIVTTTSNAERFTIDISDATKADATLKAIDYAISKVSSQRAALGTVQNRMEYASNNLSTTQENLTAAESRIRDVDMAEEMVAYTKNSILNESAMAMLAQANKQPENILTLLQ